MNRLPSAAGAGAGASATGAPAASSAEMNNGDDDVLTADVRNRLVNVLRSAEEMMSKNELDNLHDEIELEVRLQWGAATAGEEGARRSSIPLDLFQAIYSKFPLTEEERNTMPWFTDLGIMQVCDYVWLNAPGNRGGDNNINDRETCASMRDRVFFEPFGSATAFDGEVKQCTERVHKVVVSKCDFKCATLPECMFRVALCREKRYNIEGPISGSGSSSGSREWGGGAAGALLDIDVPPIPPTSLQTKMVRIKHTHSFLYTSRYMWQPAWKFIFSQCWSGETRSAAERRFHLSPTSPDTCEVEIELINPVKYRECVNSDSLREGQYTTVAESIVRKIISLYLPVEEELQIEVPHVASSCQRDEETAHCRSVFRLTHK